MLEQWRRMQNVYYEVYNNGCCNWGNYGIMMRALTKKFKVALILKKNLVEDSINSGSYVKLEELADKVYEAAIEEFNQTGK
ncbi:MAG: hypothetical protein QM489_00900 [Candidatus Izemoplasma sp.]